MGRHFSTEMKLSAGLGLIGLAASADPSKADICFAKNIDIDGGFGQMNVVRKFNKGVYSAAACQNHCLMYKRRGCEYFVWQDGVMKCSLFNSLSGLEYDAEDEGEEKYTGPVVGCLPCHREGWDYVTSNAPSNNLSGRSGVYGVDSVYKCAAICNLSEDCYFVTYNQAKKICYPQSLEAHKGIRFAKDHQVAPKDCRTPNCVTNNTKYENGWVTVYDLVGRVATSGIPGVKKPMDCHRICMNIEDCQFWTYDTDDEECFPVKSDEYLEADSDKVSGARRCLSGDM